MMLMAANAWSQVVPSAPLTSTGNYTVTWTPDTAAIMYLEERVGANGAWGYVNNSLYTYSGASVSVAFTNKPPGEYFYRTSAMYTTYYGGSYWLSGPETRVFVTGGPPATQDRIENQGQYVYATRAGDINADGRTDLFVTRVSGGQPNNGTLEHVILRQLADKTFAADVPSSGQYATASAWPAANVSLSLEDVNLDGFIDVRLDGVGSIISGALDQIVVSSGLTQVLAPQRVIPRTAKFNKFHNDAGKWIENPNYFIQNSPIINIPVYTWIYICYGYYDYYNQCGYVQVLVGYQQVHDLSAFDSDAVLLSLSFNQTANGSLLPTINPGSTDAGRIDQVFRTIYGIPLMRGVLTGPCQDYDYDPQDTTYRIPCVNWGYIILNELNLHTSYTNWRYLTSGEKAAVLYEGLQIRDVDKVRVYNKGYSIFNWNSWIMTPNGNVYIGPKNDWMMPWSEDYSLIQGPGQLYLSILIHELTHVYQTRNRGCIAICMYVREGLAVLGNGYRYYPPDLDLNKSYFSYNIEQQAQMVQDRFEIRRCRSAFAGQNSGVPLSQLKAKIPWSVQGHEACDL